MAPPWLSPFWQLLLPHCFRGTFTSSMYVSVITSFRWFWAVHAFLRWWTFGLFWSLIDTQVLWSFVGRPFCRWFLLDKFSGVWLVHIELYKKLGKLLPKWPYCFELPPGIYESPRFPAWVLLCAVTVPLFLVDLQGSFFGRRFLLVNEKLSTEFPKIQWWVRSLVTPSPGCLCEGPARTEDFVMLLPRLFQYTRPA